VSRRSFGQNANLSVQASFLFDSPDGARHVTATRSIYWRRRRRLIVGRLTVVRSATWRVELTTLLPPQGRWLHPLPITSSTSAVWNGLPQDSTDIQHRGIGTFRGYSNLRIDFSIYGETGFGFGETCCAWTPFYLQKRHTNAIEVIRLARWTCNRFHYETESRFVNWILWWSSVYVYLSVSLHNWKITWPNFARFLCMLPVAILPQNRKCTTYRSTIKGRQSDKLWFWFLQKNPQNSLLTIAMSLGLLQNLFPFCNPHRPTCDYLRWKTDEVVVEIFGGICRFLRSRLKRCSCYVSNLWGYWTDLNRTRTRGSYNIAIECFWIRAAIFLPVSECQPAE